MLLAPKTLASRSRPQSPPASSAQRLGPRTGRFVTQSLHCWGCTGRRAISRQAEEGDAGSRIHSRRQHGGLRARPDLQGRPGARARVPSRRPLPARSALGSTVHYTPTIHRGALCIRSARPLRKRLSSLGLFVCVALAVEAGEASTNAAHVGERPTSPPFIFRRCGNDSSKASLVTKDLAHKQVQIPPLHISQSVT